MKITDSSYVQLDLFVRIDSVELRDLIRGEAIGNSRVSIQYRESPLATLERSHNEDRIKRLEGAMQ